MSEDRSGRAWFAPKEFGYGATPVTWEGWALTLAFVLVVVVTASFFVPSPRDPAHLIGLYRLQAVRVLHPSLPAVVAAILVESAGFIALTRWKSSGPWFWRWGPRR